MVSGQILIICIRRLIVELNEWFQPEESAEVKLCMSLIITEAVSQFKLRVQDHFCGTRHPPIRPVMVSE